MEPYIPMTMHHEEALDFTSSPKMDAIRSYQEAPVLDLSCKKTSSPSSSIHGGDITSHARLVSPDNTHNQEKPASFSDAERKSPFEGRSFMVTPPSESDSPKKTKYEPIYNCPATNPLLSQPSSFSTMPMNMPVPIVPAVLPGLLTQNNHNHLQIVGAPATSTTTTGAPQVYQREMAVPTTQAECSKKAPRPFKAYPKDPLSLTMGPAELVYDPNSNEAYSEFRKRMLESVRRSNEGTNIKMRRVTKSPGLPTSTVDEKDAAYWERRRKNNEAAKRSRDARRAKEDEIAIRAAFLEQENMKLKYELVALRNETAKLRCMVYSK